MTIRPLFVALTLAMPIAASAESFTLRMHAITPQGIGEPLGDIKVTETRYGTLFTPALEGLPPGLHGFHIHENASCEPGTQNGEAKAGLAAGGHYDPDQTGKHLGPYEPGHLGDLPALFADEAGKATLPVLAPRVKGSDVRGHALMIHHGGDNYSDTPTPLGGGGGRIACGMVPAAS